MAVQSRKVLINGAGTVGTRGADVLLSMGIPVLMCKYGNYPDDADGLDTKTKELKGLIERHPDKDIPIFAANGPDLERRIEKIREHVGRCDGSIMEYIERRGTKISLAIDATDGKGIDTWNAKDIYGPHSIPFAVNGGGDKTIVKHLFFAGVLGSLSESPAMQDTYRDENAMIVSCNSHATVTGLTRVMKAVGGSDRLKELMKGHVLVKLDRRSYDPRRAREAGKIASEFVTISNESYHVNEMEFLVPEFSGKLQTQVAKWPVEYFHTGMIMMQFKEAISQDLLDAVRGEFKEYDRAVFTEGDLSHERNINAAYWAGIPDGQIPFGIYNVNTLGPVGKSEVLLINFNTPQRDIVALPTADYVLLRTGAFGTDNFGEAFAHVNSEGSYFGQNPARFAQSMQYSLHPQNYDRLLGERGPAPLEKA